MTVGCKICRELICTPVPLDLSDQARAAEWMGTSEAMVRHLTGRHPQLAAAVLAMGSVLMHWFASQSFSSVDPHFAEHQVKALDLLRSLVADPVLFLGGLLSEQQAAAASENQRAA